MQFDDQPAGLYNLRLTNKLGQVIVSKQINHTEGNTIEVLEWDYNLAHGVYQLDITRPDGSIKNINLMY